jgi:hypothetical protein
MRAVALLTGPSTHLDHLGVLSTLLKIPLIVTEEKHYRLAQEYYPDLKAELKGLRELSLEHLAFHYDMIFETGKSFAAELTPLLQHCFQKTMRFVFCPHGNSDKGHSQLQHLTQDISLIYGDHLRDLLTQNGAAAHTRHLVRTGNYRYTYYLRHKKFFDILAEEKVFCQLPCNKPTLLYAPTWSNSENPTSFFTATHRLIQELCGTYNLLIKLHPLLIESEPARALHIMARYEAHPSVLFLNDFPPIYPLLSRCALYLGDYSSIGYDFLAFDRPLYFLTPQKSSSPSPLHTCGLEIPLKEDIDIHHFITSTLESSRQGFAEQRKKIYRYAFGEEVAFETIKKEIFIL